MKRFKSIGLTAVLLLLGALCFAKGGADLDTSAANLKFYTFSKAGVGLEVVERFVEWFGQEYPGITVEFESPQGSFHTSIFADFAAGTPPDVYNQGGIELEMYNELGIPENLMPYIKKDPDFKESEMLDPIYDYFRLNNDPKADVYALSTGWSANLLFYNKTMFEEAGLETPKDLYEKGEWDWDAFLNAMRKLAKDTDGDGKVDQFGYQVAGWHSNIFELLYMNGLDSLWAGEEDEILNYDTPEVREMYSTIHDLIWKEHVMPQPGDIDAYEGFTIGRVGMMITGSFTVGRLDELDSDWEYDFTYLPKKEKDHVTLYSNGVAMTTTTKYKDQAWLFVRDFATAKGAELLAETKFGFPITKEDYRSMENDPIWEECLKIARPTQRHRRMSTARLVFQKHHVGYMDDPNADLDQFIEDIVKEGSEALQEEL